MQRSCSIDPDGRYADAGEFLAALDEAAERSMGAGWWETAGIGTLVAATTSTALTALAGTSPAAVTEAAVQAVDARQSIRPTR